jgi:NADH pyrophosphatase NudC (nudix superfamily)
MAEIEVFRARNTTGLAINGTRVTETKPYGLIQTTQKFKADDEEITKALRIDVQPVKHGKWRKAEQGYDTYVECSECGLNLEMSNYVESEWRELLKYCPRCGARMDLKEGDAE